MCLLKTPMLNFQVLGIFFPRAGQTYYSPLPENSWRIILEAIGVILTFYFIVCETNVIKSCKRAHYAWIQWRTRSLEEDLNFCHPRWPEEEAYLRSEMEQIKR